MPPFDYFKVLSCPGLTCECPGATGDNQQWQACQRPLDAGNGNTQMSGEGVNPRDFVTYNPGHAQALKSAVGTLKSHYALKVGRPLNCLLLGPPGSGKTFLAKLLGAASGAEFFEFNLARCGSSERLEAIFRQLADVATGRPKLVLMDEFDLTVGGSSMLRYFLYPMYEGRLDSTSKELGNTAFVFSGGYLRNRQLLSALLRSGSDFDFLKFLYDLYLSGSTRNGIKSLVHEMFLASVQYRGTRDKLTPDQDALDYLRRLDKLVDFLSRINGFVLEVPDLSSPLAVTDRAMRVSPGSDHVTPSDKHDPEELYAFVRGLESPLRRFGCSFADASDPLLQFKNMLLLERLSRVLRFIKSRCRQSAKSGLTIRRSLLNFLTVVPLVHGMRSLECLTGHCCRSGSPDGLNQGDGDACRMHIRCDGEFSSPESLWSAMQMENADFDCADKSIEITF